MTSNPAMEIHHFDWSKFNVDISNQKRALSKQTPLRHYLAGVTYEMEFNQYLGYFTYIVSEQCSTPTLWSIGENYSMMNVVTNVLVNL